jgi:outer membrane protein assembly factor BamB
MKSHGPRCACELSVVCLLIALPGMRLAPAEKPSDWPQFRGPAGGGTSADKGLPVTWSGKENLVWKSELPGPGASSPILVGSRIFLTCYAGQGAPGQASGGTEQLELHVVCLDRESGKVLWDKEVEPRLPEQEKIREDHGYASSTPAADTERVYAFFGKSGVVALDHGGRQLWRADVGSGISGWGSAASPVLFRDLVIVNASVESESLVALDSKTGKEVWRAGGIRESWNTPILAAAKGGKVELVVAIAGKVLGLEPTTGEQLWSCATDIGWYMVPSLVAQDGVAYCIGGRSGGGLAVRMGGRGDVTKTHRPWKILKGSNVSSPILHEGRLYWLHENIGVAYCADARTGEIIKEVRIEGAGQFYASPVLADGKLYCVSRGGRTYVLAAGPELERLAANDLGERGTFNASPAISGSRLLLRSERCLYCLGAK